MRLIDADKLLEPGYTDMFDEPIRFDMVSRYAIETASTVKAIPIEWIEKWISERNDFPTMPYNQHIWNMLDDWKAERKEE